MIQLLTKWPNSPWLPSISLSHWPSRFTLQPSSCLDLHSASRNRHSLCNRSSCSFLVQRFDDGIHFYQLLRSWFWFGFFSFVLGVFLQKKLVSWGKKSENEQQELGQFAGECKRYKDSALLWDSSLFLEARNCIDTWSINTVTLCGTQCPRLFSTQLSFTLPVNNFRRGNKMGFDRFFSADELVVEGIHQCFSWQVSLNTAGREAWCEVDIFIKLFFSSAAKKATKRSHLELWYHLLCKADLFKSAWRCAASVLVDFNSLPH